MIPGVETIPLTTHVDERGFFREILKINQIKKFGQWSMSWMTTGTIKAWHIHKVQTDYWFVVSGVVKAAVCKIHETSKDGTKFSSSQAAAKYGYYGDTEEFLMGDNQTPFVLVIPPGVAHGLKVLQGPAILMYVTSETYNPEDEGRIPYDALGYDWFKQNIR
jgi:dTDP-4-dehydrorhamnose 3,5-epimerase